MTSMTDNSSVATCRLMAAAALLLACAVVLLPALPAHAAVTKVTVGMATVYDASGGAVKEVAGVSYDVDARALSLDGATVSVAKKGVAGIQIAAAKTDTVAIKLAGANSISAKGDGIVSKAGLKLAGTGSLKVTSAKGVAVNSTAGKVTFAAKKLVAEGKLTGVYGKAGVKLSKGKVSASGAEYAIGCGSAGKVANDPARLKTVKGKLATGARFKKAGSVYRATASGGVAKLVTYGGGAKAKVGEVTYGSYDYHVTEIGAGAFKGNKKVTQVTLGSDVASIGKNAFSGTSKLTMLDLRAASGLYVSKQKGNSVSFKFSACALKAFAKCGKGGGKKLHVYCGWTSWNLGTFKSALVKKGLPKAAKVTT